MQIRPILSFLTIPIISYSPRAPETARRGSRIGRAQGAALGHKTVSSIVSWCFEHAAVGCGEGLTGVTKGAAAFLFGMLEVMNSNICLKPLRVKNTRV